MFSNCTKRLLCDSSHDLRPTRFPSTQPLAPLSPPLYSLLLRPLLGAPRNAAAPPPRPPPPPPPRNKSSRALPRPPRASARPRDGAGKAPRGNRQGTRERERMPWTKGWREGRERKVRFVYDLSIYLHFFVFLIVDHKLYTLFWGGSHNASHNVQTTTTKKTIYLMIEFVFSNTSAVALKTQCGFPAQ